MAGEQNAIGNRQLNKANNLSDLANAAAARGNLGANAVGSNIFTLADPGAIRYLRINGDNSISALTLAQLQTDLGYEENIDFSASANVQGFSGTPTVVYRYSRYGKMYIVNFAISGTSNSTTMEFDLPAAPLITMIQNGFTASDNGAVVTTPGRIAFTAGNVQVTCRRAPVGTAFTNSGVKALQGTFCYLAQ